jgi:hypothetical protein
MQWVFCVAEKQLASQEGHCLRESVALLLLTSAFFFYSCLEFSFQEMNRYLVFFF